MQVERIETLVGMMPARNAYANRIGGDAFQTPAEVSLYANALADPMFGWCFTKAFLDAKKPLPETVTESPLLRAYCYYAYSNRDPDVRRAFQLRTQAEKIRRTMLHCMLLIEKYDLKHISGELQLDLDVVRIYEMLFWNVRDRLQDKMFVNSLVYPETTQVLWVKQYHLNEDPLNLALRAAVTHGMETVKAFLGMTNQTDEFDAEGYAKAFEAQVVSTASHSARMGLLHQSDVPSISSGRSMVQSSKLGGDVAKDDDSRLGLGSFGMKAAVLEHWRRLTDHDLQYRLRLQQIGIQKELTGQMTAPRG